MFYPVFFKLLTWFCDCVYVSYKHSRTMYV